MARKSRERRKVPAAASLGSDAPRSPTSLPSLSSTKRQAILALLVLTVLGAVIYSNSLDGEFLFDDTAHIVDTSDLHHLGHVDRWWGHDQRRPIGYLTLALNYHFHGLEVRGYHIFNVAIHILNGWLVFWLVSLTLRTPVLAGSPLASQRILVSLCAALVFVSHPIMTQAVAYVVQRLASLATLFYLCSLALYVTGRMHLVRKPVVSYVGAGVTAVLAMLTKENAATLPLAVVLFEICLLQKGTFRLKGGHLLTAIGFGAVVLLIVPALLGFDASRVFRTIPPTQGHTYTLTPGTYLMTEFSVLVTYLRLLVFPVNQNLDYDFPIAASLFELRTLGSLAILLVVLSVAVLSYRRMRLVSFGIFWWFLTLSVESSVIPIPNVIFEHRLYLPMFGFACVAIGVAGKHLATRPREMLALFAVLAAVWGVATYERNEVWSSEYTLWADVVEKSPDKARPLANFGKVLKERGETERALEYVEAALAVAPDYPEALNTLGNIWLDRGRLDEALDLFDRALQSNPEYVSALNGRGIALGRGGDLDAAIETLDRVVEANPEFAEGWNNLSNAHAMKGDLDRAIACGEKAVRLMPDNATFLSNLGASYYEMSNFEKAVECFERALRANPGDQAVRRNLEAARGALRR